MTINELSKSLEVKNKDVISFLKEEGYKVSSHLQNATDEMITAAKEHFAETSKEESVEEDPILKAEKVEESPKETVSNKVFSPDDRIPCRSVTPWELNEVGVDRMTVYHWKYFGDVDYVAYRDLQSWRRKDIVTKPSIIIEDPDLCSQWRRELGEIYKPFIGVEYPEELFDLPNDEFEKLLKNGTKLGRTIREIVKTTAMNMIKNENYPDINKIKMMDDILGTCIKEFL